MTRKIITDFTGGEVSDRLMARIDSPLYPRTLRTLENFIVHASGGADFRPGTYYCGGAKTNTGVVRLIPFVRSPSEAYVLELSDQLMRVWKDGTLVQSGGGNLELTMPWLAADLFELKYAQNKDNMYFSHPDYQPVCLTFAAEDSWTWTDADWKPHLCIVDASTAKVYDFYQDTFQYIQTPPSLPGGSNNGCAISPNGVYLAIATSASPYINIYKRSNDTYSKLSDPATLPTGAGQDCCWSPDGTYLAVAHTTSPYITIYKRNGDTFTKLSDPATLPAGNAQSCHFSANGVYLAVAHATSPYITIYKRSGDTFTKLSDPSSLPAGTGAYSVGFSSDNTHLAVGSNASPFITIYRRSGDVFSKLADPATLPTGRVDDCKFSPIGTHLATAHDVSPYVTIYRRTGDTFTKLANPGTLPTGTGHGCAWSFDNIYLAIAHSVSPYITIYKRSGDTFTKLTDPTTLPGGIGNECFFTQTGWSDIPWSTDYPSALTFHEQRLVFGRNSTVWASMTGYPQTFSQDPSDASYGYEYEFASDVLELIRWMVTKSTGTNHYIIIGTTYGEWIMTGGNQPISASNVYVGRVSAHGSADIAAVLANESVVFVQKGGQRLREFMYSEERGGYISPDLTQLADHIGVEGFKELEWQRSPRSMLWTVRDNGELAALTLDRNHRIQAWHRHPMASATVESVAVIPGTAEDVVYMVVRRAMVDDLNWIYNGDCEKTDPPYIIYDGYSLLNCSATRSADKAYGGSYSFKHTKTSAAGAGASQFQFVDVISDTDLHGFVPGATYRATIRVYIPSTGGPAGDEVYFQFGHYYSGGWHYVTQFSSVQDGWELLQLDFTVDSGATGAFLQICIKTDAELNEYIYWDEIILERTDSGWNTKKYIEYLKPINRPDDEEDYFFVDSGITYDGAPATEITGLDHLEGETVTVYADGEELGDEVVSDGKITINSAASKVQVGLQITGKLWTQRLGNFSSIRASEGVLLLYKTRGGKIGPNTNSLESIIYENDAVITGPQEVRIGGRFSRDGSIMIVQDKPYSMTLLGLLADMTVE